MVGEYGGNRWSRGAMIDERFNWRFVVVSQGQGCHVPRFSFFRTNAVFFEKFHTDEYRIVDRGERNGFVSITRLVVHCCHLFRIGIFFSKFSALKKLVAKKRRGNSDQGVRVERTHSSDHHFHISSFRQSSFLSAISSTTGAH